MCDCSNYCQLLVGPRSRAPHRGSARGRSALGFWSRRGASEACDRQIVGKSRGVQTCAIVASGLARAASTRSSGYRERAAPLWSARAAKTPWTLRRKWCN